MKYLKTYETLNESLDPEIGDYVICKEEGAFNSIFDFTSNNIGKFVEFEEVDYSHAHYIIAYENVPKKIADYFINGSINRGRRMYRHEIKYWSKDKKELEIILTANKYNL